MTVKYLKPRILTIDVASQVVSAIKNSGYNVSEGTFGCSYSISKSSSYYDIFPDSLKMPFIDEQEILIIDIGGGNLISQPHSYFENGIEYVAQIGKQNVINSRPYNMKRVREKIQKIFDHAGICIILTSSKFSVEYHKILKNYPRIEVMDKMLISNWSFLNLVDNFTVVDEPGYEFTFHNNDLSNLIRKYSEGATFSCSFDNHPTDNLSIDWTTLATNKYGRKIAALLKYKKQPKYILFLPKLPKLSNVIIELLEKFVAEWHPILFPHLEGANWIHRREYELPRVINLLEQIDLVKNEALSREKELLREIAQLQSDSIDWYTLLNGTGDELVKSVINSLISFGFNIVIDVDIQEKEKGNQNLREDIQIQDRSPILVIDVKGIKDCPDDNESMQSNKHATMRMRELNRTDVKPLTIVNHQKHIPPLERNPNVYRNEIVNNAIDLSVGLMTTWDIFRILRNKEHLGWSNDNIQPIFYRSGLISPIPENYSYIGKVVEVWKNAFGVVIEENHLDVGDCIAVEFPILFEKLVVNSIQVNKISVQRAIINDPAGIQCENYDFDIKKGMKVYRII